ncbi:MAG: ABC transporter ATP-binding protein/permease [Prevotellaceae bacterium]|jgi:ABC-type multidrug transport system fused ATPase/permease subunit|nr:ABC transporter ATP-binding protein/permease [Prevotellaceae bacterium]
MKNFLILFTRFLPPYKRYVVANILCNLLSTIFSLFSFGTIIPILQILFGMEGENHSYIAWAWTDSFKEIFNALKNNIFYIIEQYIQHHGASTTLLMLGVFLVVMTLMKTGLMFLAGYYMTPIQYGVLRDLRRRLYDKIVVLPIGFFSEERKGDIMARMTGDVQEIGNSIMSSLDIIFKNPVMVIIYLAVMLSISWQLTLFVLVLLPIGGLIIGRVGKSLKKRSMRGQVETGELLSQIEETLGGLRIVKAFNAEEKVRARFSEINERVRRTFNRMNRKYILAHPVSEFLGTAIIVIVMWYGGTLIINQTSSITAPSFIYYLIIFYSIINPVKDISKATYTIQKGLASLDRVDAILKAENPITDKKDAVSVHGFKREIEFRAVSFAYQPDVWVLRDINLRIEKGKMVALVGQSGSGKSTMVDLLPRFYDVQQGEILIDGKNVKDIKVHDLRAQMGNVNQEAILFNDSFYNNITFGVEHATMDEVIAAAKIANAHNFIVASENGYETNIGDRGGKLSGGQRQRISIARAILKNPPILILDEATSALDTESEKLVQEAIDNLMQNRTSIVVAHRLSTIKKADLICVMHEGRIVERGRHDELIALNGYYKRLCDMQSF